MKLSEKLCTLLMGDSDCLGPFGSASWRGWSGLRIPMGKPSQGQDAACRRRQRRSGRGCHHPSLPDVSLVQDCCMNHVLAELSGNCPLPGQHAYCEAETMSKLFCGVAFVGSRSWSYRPARMVVVDGLMIPLLYSSQDQEPARPEACAKSS